MAIPATSPTALPAATFDQWDLSIQTLGFGCVPFGAAAPPAGGSNPAPIRLLVTALKSRLRPDGLRELSPLPADRRAFEIKDLYAYAGANADAAQALAALIAAIQSYGTAQGIF